MFTYADSDLGVHDGRFYSVLDLKIKVNIYFINAVGSRDPTKTFLIRVTRSKTRYNTNCSANSKY